MTENGILENLPLSVDVYNQMMGYEIEQVQVRPHRLLVVYLAGPFRPYTDGEGVVHGIAENVRTAGQYGLQVWKLGYVALVPHTLTYLDPKRQRQDGGIAGIDPETFMQGELELIRRSDVLVLLPNWRYSRGAIAEKLFAEEHGIPVVEWEVFVNVPAE